ncbi:MAG: response regulator [Candidatus Acidiferrales bacterium]
MKSVLIVDDSSVMRKIIERCLRQSGMKLKNIHEANDGYEGLSILQENAVDLILCDINMPTMDGLEFLQALATSEEARRIPVVMITTEGSEDRVYEALSNGARGYIRKPFTAEQLKEQVGPLLEN